MGESSNASSNSKNTAGFGEGLVGGEDDGNGAKLVTLRLAH